MNAIDSFIDLAEAERRRASVSTLRPGKSSARNFGTVLLDDVELDPEAEWLIAGVLPDRALSAIWGDPGCGKSFMALDMALAVAQGALWFDNACAQGGVAYIAAEGGRGVKKRLLAYRKRFGTAAGLPFALIPSAVDLATEDHETEALIGELARVAERMTAPLRLVVIDTLSRAMAGANENDSQDMGALIRNADRIREATGAHVLFVHHGGKDSTRKTRGHSSLFGALDTAIEVTVDKDTGIRTAKVDKQKDGEDGRTFKFNLDVEEIAMFDDGPITSCVVVPATEDAPESTRTSGNRKTSGVSAVALDALRRAIVEGGTIPPASPHIPPNTPAVSHDLWKGYFYQLRGSQSTEANRKAFQRVVVDLQNRKMIGIWGDFVWLI